MFTVVRFHEDKKSLITFLITIPSSIVITFSSSVYDYRRM